jgi:putative toxin-antitoxin system antitoxin component (TIGR02293 family)
VGVLAEKLEVASSKLEMDQAEIARAIDANPRTVARWLQGDTEPRPDARERLLELIAVLERLSGVLQPDAGHDWLFTPNPLLDNHKPVDLLRDREYRQVLGAIDAMAEGVYV